MKQKLFTLLTLLVLCVTGAWAAAGTDVLDSSVGSSAFNGTGVALAATYTNGQGGGNIAGYTPTNKGFKMKVRTTTVTISSTTYGYVLFTAQEGKILNSIEVLGTSNGKDNQVVLTGIYEDINTESLAESIAGATNKLNETKTYPNNSTNYITSGSVSVNASSNLVLLFDYNSSNSEGRFIVNVGYEDAAATVAPVAPTFTPNGGDVFGSSTTTIASTYAQKIYYCWTSSATAPAQDAEATWTEASGDSKEFIIPNVTATNMFLHAYGWNNYNTSSKSATNTSNAFNVTKRSAAAKTYNFASAFSDELKAILVHETTGKFVLNGSRYESKAKIDKDTDNDLGTYSGVTEWNGLVFGRTGNDIASGSLRIQENGYIQINGGNGYYKLEGLYDGDVVRVRCASANADITNTRKFTVTGATVDEISVKGSDAGYYEFELTKAGNGDFSIKQDNGINLWVISVNQTLPAVPEVAVSTAAGNTYATVVTSYALDFSTVSEDITAYIVTDKETNTVTTEAVTMVPARTAILVKTKSAGVTVDVPRASGATALSTNKLKYSASPIEVNTTNDNVDKIYAFFKVSEQYGFAPVAENTTLPANKAYLKIDGGELQANFLALDLDGETTAINEVKGMKTNAKGEYYNLAGQRVAQPTKGLYIVNGRKVVIK